MSSNGQWWIIRQFLPLQVNSVPFPVIWKLRRLSTTNTKVKLNLFILISTHKLLISQRTGRSIGPWNNSFEYSAPLKSEFQKSLDCFVGATYLNHISIHLTFPKKLIVILKKAVVLQNHYQNVAQLCGYVVKTHFFGRRSAFVFIDTHFEPHYLKLKIMARVSSKILIVVQANLRPPLALSIIPSDVAFSVYCHKEWLFTNKCIIIKASSRSLQL